MSELGENGPVQALTSQSKRRRKLLIWSVVSLVNVGLLALLLTQLLTPAKVAVSDPLVGHPAPDFSLTMLESPSGQSLLSLADLKGKAVVLNFWASWCAPCKEELPLLEQQWEQAQAQGQDVVFLGIDFEEASNDAANFLQTYHVTYLIGLDTDGSVASKYGITALPQTIFINRQGTVVKRVAGELTAQVLSSSLQLVR
jgi:cytochrome c biogenesis protein CcmG/thiol:disulfide interchange protein DsbE